MTAETHHMHIIAYMQHAWHVGHHVQQTRVKIGNEFLGAMPEAIANGYPRDTSGYRMFLSGYLYALPKRILVSPTTNRIVELK